MARHLVPLTCLLLALLTVLSCQDLGIDPTSTPPPGGGGPPLTISFQTNIYPIFSKSAYGCNGCHTGPPNDIYWYGSTASATYSNLVNVNALRGACAPNKRVLPGNANQSVLYLRLAGSTCGDRMPQGGSAMASADLNLIRDWINQGAPNN